MFATASTGTGAVPLKVLGLTKRFGSRTALSDVSFAIRAGEVVAVIGPNRAGKTTLLAILAGAMPASGAR